MADNELLFLRDLADVEPPREVYKRYDHEDIYKLVPKPQWTGLEDELWTPRANEDDPQLEKVKALIKRNSGQDNMSEMLLNRTSSADADGEVAKEKYAQKGKRRRTSSQFIRDALNNKWLEAVLLIATIWALFAEDARYSLERPGAEMGDTIFWSLHFTVCIMFALELIARSVVQRGYFNSFFFWLDCIAVASMITDFLPLFQKQDSGSVGENTDASDAARAGRAARAGTKVGRLMRLLRIVRVLKLFLAARKRKHEQMVEVTEYTPSELGKELKNRITQKSIIFVLSLLVISALLEFALDSPPTDFTPAIATAQLYLASNYSARGAPFQLFSQSGTVNRNSLAANFSASKGEFEGDPFFLMRQVFEKQFVRYFPFNLGDVNLLLRLDIYNLTYYYPSDPSHIGWDLNDDPNIDPFLGGFGGNYYPNCNNGVFGDSDLVQEYCPYEIYHLRAGIQERTQSIIEIAPYTYPNPDLSSDVERPSLGQVWISRREYVLCESYYSIFFTICVCFLLGLMGYLFSRDADQMVIRPIENMVDSVTKLAANPAYKLEQVKQVKYETDALYVSLAKIAALLQVGFGEAGNNLVAENLKNGDSVDPMVPGKKLLGAFGFCIIDDYEEVLECLGEEVLPFTNVAAEIVHSAVTENEGQPNRNLGDAFLCVWKPRYPEGVEDPSPSEAQKAEMRMCDGALTAFRTCVRNISSSSKLQAYNNDEEILKYFDGQYKTVIGYGLHYGYAIEGAVGTNIKIDCSYLSPNVNLAARLETATKMYGVTILMSEYFVSKLSRPVKAGLRRIDVVCLKGSSIPMAVYTCDRSNALYCSKEAVDRFGADKVIQEFQALFEEAVDGFISGDWPTAKVCLEAAQEICPNDIPAMRLLSHMDTPEEKPDFGLASTPFVAPEGWPGYHILQNK